MNQDRFKTLVISSLAALALILAATGIYGVTAFLLGERTREIAIRIALGARVTWVVRQLVTEGIRWIVVAALVGLLVARILGSLAKHYIPELTDTAALAYTGTAALLIIIGGVATVVPTLRASRVSPAQVLRGD